MADRDNYRRGRVFKELVALHLQNEGIPAELPPVTRSFKDLADVLADDNRPASDLWGIPGWSLKIHSAYALDHSGALDAAQRAGEVDGSKFSAVVAYRKTRSAGEQYAVVSLSTLAALMKATMQPTENA